jgi:hypothetical protein
MAWSVMKHVRDCPPERGLQGSASSNIISWSAVNVVCHTDLEGCSRLSWCLTAVLVLLLLFAELEGQEV